MASSNSLTDLLNSGQVTNEIHHQVVSAWLSKARFLELMAIVHDTCSSIPFTERSDFADCLVEEVRDLVFELLTGEHRGLIGRAAYGLAQDAQGHLS